MFEIAPIDGSAWAALGAWAALWLVLVITGLVLLRREKQRGGPL